MKDAIQTISRRDALRKLGLLSLAGFVIPTLTTISEAEAGGRRRKSKSKGKSKSRSKSKSKSK